MRFNIFISCLLVSMIFALTLPVLHAADQPDGTTAGMTLEASPKGWSLHAVSVDAHELFTTLAAAGNMQLIVDDTVKRQVTINIVDKPALDILKTVVDAYGFSWAEIDGVQIISEGMPRSPSSYLLSDIASVRTKYVSPSQAWNLLPAFLQGEVKINTDQNSVVLSGPRAVLEKFRQDVEQFDQPAQQIMLDVNVIEFTDLTTDNFAALLEYSNGKVGITTDSLTGQMTLTALTQLPERFNAQLQSLITQRKARVRANPRVATLSGQGAKIFIGQQQYLTTPVNIPGRGASNNIDAGVSLEITPLTGGNGEIILDLNEEISTLSAPDSVTNLPTKTTRSARSIVRVQDGQTVIIGGLRQKESRSVQRAIPILSSIPLLGALFRSQKVENTEVDLAVFITARTLSPTGHLSLKEEEAMKARMGIEGAPKP